MSLADEIERLQGLRASGAISAEEFEQAKARLLRGDERRDTFGDQLNRLIPTDVEEQTRLWAMFLHISVLAGYVVPMGGFVLPILIWQVKKGDLPEIDEHGKIVANWLISKLIYLAVGTALAFFGIGLVILIALVILGVIFPIIGAIKARDGIAWRYPMSISFFK